jgi:DNA polymerase elongation subunit (family B)
MFVDAILDRKESLVKVVERINKDRKYVEYPLEYSFYHPAKNGKFTSIFGDKLDKYIAKDNFDFKEKLQDFENERIFESDINPIFKCLEENYRGCDTPTLNIGFFDIETDFDPEKGYADPWDTFAPITAISLYDSSTNILHTLALVPPTLTKDEAVNLCSDFQNTIVYSDEKELLKKFLKLIYDIDVLSGWNSKGFDIPYIINRIKLLLGDSFAKRLCLWNMNPKEKEYNEFGKIRKTYELMGRIHLDYLQLYKKHNGQELQSYKLDYVAEIEVGDNKTPYEGTLDQLYKNDFKKFIDYNRQDTLLLYKIDKKKKFIELANQIAHYNGVLLPTTMGSVLLVEQAIIQEAHDKGLKVPDRKKQLEENEDIEITPAVGAYVANPKVGIHQQVGSIDINSLYPSVIRALNMGPETLFGHIRPEKTDSLLSKRLREGWKKTDTWEGLFCTLEFEELLKQSDENITIDFEDGTASMCTAKELYVMIFKEDSKYLISANGTIFRKDKKAIIPGLLEKWYSERKIMKAKSEEYYKLASGVKIENNDFLNKLKGLL